MGIKGGLREGRCVAAKRTADGRVEGAPVVTYKKVAAAVAASREMMEAVTLIETPVSLLADAPSFDIVYFQALVFCMAILSSRFSRPAPMVAFCWWMSISSH